MSAKLGDFCNVGTYHYSLFEPQGGVAPEPYFEDFEDKRKELCEGVSRSDVVKELRNMGTVDSAKAGQRFEDCGSKYYLHQCDDPTCRSVDISGSRCNSRICPECGKKRMGKIVMQNLDKLKSLEKNPHAKVRPAHLVLTFKNVSAEKFNTREYHVWMRKCVQKFLNRKWIKARIKGGIYSIECKRPVEGYKTKKPGRETYEIAPGRLYNTHVHMLIEAEYIPNKAGRSRILSKIWHDITGDSYITYIKQKKNARGALVECLKYVLAPGNLGDARSYANYVMVTKDLKAYNTFGTFKGHFQLTKKDPDFIKKCRFCETSMNYLASIDKTEALRYYHLVKGPPKDKFGRFTDLGYPKSLILLHGCCAPDPEKITVGGF